MMNLQQALAYLPAARWVGGDDPANLQVLRVHTDTRSLQPGDLFVALKGERFDAHDFLAQAKAQGAVAAIAQNGLAEAGLPGLQVPDSRLALGQLAAAWRTQFNLPLIAVAGSNGKTTVTQMIASILQAWHGPAAFATEGNLNNDIGVPLTLLRLRTNHTVGVVELGMNHPGEIAELARIARPSVALVNNAQREHLEFMGTVEAVAHENGAVISALGPQGIAVFPADDAYTPLWSRLAGGRHFLRFALSRRADVTAQARWQTDTWQVDAWTPAGRLRFSLALAGQHNVKNALAATACAIAAGVPLPAIAAGLSAFRPVKGRSRVLALRWGENTLTLVDDSYNANPDSMRAAIDVLADLPGPRLLVMGDMGEVGTQGPAFHAEAAAYAQAKGIEALFTLGAQSQHASAAFAQSRHFADMPTLLDAVQAELPHVVSVLVKGSRFMQMERVVEMLVQQANGPSPMNKDTPHAA